MAYTSALLHFDGNNNGTTFTDETGKTWTASGNAKLTTTSPKFGTACGTFDGNNDYIYSNDNADFEFGSGNFTIDAWVNVTSVTTQRTIIAHGEEGNTSNYGYMLYVYIRKTRFRLWR